MLARELWESRGRSYSSEDQACKKVFDNRLIVLVKVPRYSFVPRYGFRLNRFSRRKTRRGPIFWRTICSRSFSTVPRGSWLLLPVGNCCRMWHLNLVVRCLTLEIRQRQLVRVLPTDCRFAGRAWLCLR